MGGARVTGASVGLRETRETRAVSDRDKKLVMTTLRRALQRRKLPRTDFLHLCQVSRTKFLRFLDTQIPTTNSHWWW